MRPCAHECLNRIILVLLRNMFSREFIQSIKMLNVKCVNQLLLIAAVMILIAWMLRIFVCVELLSASFTGQVAGWSETRNSKADDGCVFYCESGKVINLNSLEHTRFVQHLFA